MNLSKLIDSLDRFGRMLPALLRDVVPDDSRWKPPDGAWSILEIVCHLSDEEQFDFRERVRLTLESPAVAWPPIAPEVWAIERRYNEGDLGEATTRFRSLRKESVLWIRSLRNPDWLRTHQHPEFGRFRAGDIMASWVAHDYLHLRQIAKRMYEMSGRDAGDFSTRYAGEWHA